MSSCCSPGYLAKSTQRFRLCFNGELVIIFAPPQVKLNGRKSTQSWGRPGSLHQGRAGAQNFYRYCIHHSIGSDVDNLSSYKVMMKIVIIVYYANFAECFLGGVTEDSGVAWGPCLLPSSCDGE